MAGRIDDLCWFNGITDGLPVMKRGRLLAWSTDWEDVSGAGDDVVGQIPVALVEEVSTGRVWIVRVHEMMFCDYPPVKGEDFD